MIDITALRRIVAEGLDVIRSEVVDAEVFAAWNEQLIARLNYTSDIPCSGEYRRIHGMSWSPPLATISGYVQGSSAEGRLHSSHRWLACSQSCH
jgi:hypothetical protein